MTNQEFAEEFELTPAEMRVAVALSRGINAKQAARELGVSHHTVRQHLKAVFDKTDTHRQSALVVLIMAGPGVAGPGKAWQGAARQG